MMKFSKYKKKAEPVETDPAHAGNARTYGLTLRRIRDL